MKKNTVISILSIILIVTLIILFSIKNLFKDEILDNEKFSSEYQEIDANNVFVYRNINEIISILENGTGIVYLGFPECKWCQRYVVYLNEVAQKTNTIKINYYNILEDRKNNTEQYRKIVEILNDYLQYDEDGKKRIYVPSIIAVKNGEIVGFDDETAWDTKGYSTPDEYWNEEEIKSLKDKLEQMMINVRNDSCSECNIK